MSRITIFGREHCGYCRRAKQLCEIKQLPFHYVDIEREQISQADLEKTIGKPVHTVPQIFVGHEYLGGFEALEAHLAVENG